jgi:hypothetical protein
MCIMARIYKDVDLCESWVQQYERRKNYYANNDFWHSGSNPLIYKPYECKNNIWIVPSLFDKEAVDMEGIEIEQDGKKY